MTDRGDLLNAIRGFVSLLALCGGATPAPADERPATAGAPVEFSVLTPGLEAHFRVSTGFDLSMVGITGLTNRRHTKALRKMVEEEGHDASRRIADAILMALHDAGRTGIHEPIPRRPAGRLQSLTAAELPEEPKGAMLLDITIGWIGLHAEVSMDSLRPALSLTWRLISPDGNLVEPGRELRYVHQSGRKKPRLTDPALRPNQKNPTIAVLPETDEQKFCSFSSFSAARKDPAQLWDCFDDAYSAAARKLVDQLPERN